MLQEKRMLQFAVSLGFVLEKLTQIFIQRIIYNKSHLDFSLLTQRVGVLGLQNHPSQRENGCLSIRWNACRILFCMLLTNLRKGFKKKNIYIYIYRLCLVPKKISKKRKKNATKNCFFMFGLTIENMKIYIYILNIIKISHKFMHFKII